MKEKEQLIKDMRGMKSSASAPTMTAAGILHYQAFLPAHFHSIILAEWMHKDYRIN